MENNPSSAVAHFGAFQMRIDTGELFKNGRRLAIQERPFCVLAVLVEQPGEMVTREELRRRVWPAETFVEFDQGLNVAVHKLRATLADSAEKPRYVETLPGRGYRFIAQVSRDDVASPAPKPIHEPLEGISRSIPKWVAGAAMLLCLAVVGGFYWWPRPLPERRTVAVLPVRSFGVSQEQVAADSMTYALIAALADCGSLRVVSATSSEKYRASDKPLRQITKELGVDAVLEGSLTGADGKIHVTAQLIEASTDRSLWGGHFERGEVSPPAQAELAGTIARNVKFTLLRPGETPPGETGSFFPKPTP